MRLYFPNLLIITLEINNLAWLVGNPTIRTQVQNFESISVHLPAFQHLLALTANPKCRPLLMKNLGLQGSAHGNKPAGEKDPLLKAYGLDIQLDISKLNP